MEYGSIESRTAFVLANVDDNGTFATAEWQQGGEHYEKLKNMMNYSVMQSEGWLSKGDVENEILSVKKRFDALLTVDNLQISDSEIMNSLVGLLLENDLELHELYAETDCQITLDVVELAKLAEERELVTTLELGMMSENGFAFVMTNFGFEALEQSDENTKFYRAIEQIPTFKLTVSQLVDKCRATQGNPYS